MITTMRPVNLFQLQSEMQAASIDVGVGLGMTAAGIFRYMSGTPAEPVEFIDESAAQAVLDVHVAMRDKTDVELAAEFQAEGTTAARKQEIRDMQSGLLLREQVPM